MEEKTRDLGVLQIRFDFLNTIKLLVLQRKKANIKNPSVNKKLKKETKYKMNGQRKDANTIYIGLILKKSTSS